MLQQETSRGKEHAKMLAAALARPDVREMMEVHGNWQDKDRGLDNFRSTTANLEQSTTTNSSKNG